MKSPVYALGVMLALTLTPVKAELPSAEDLGHEIAFKGLTLSPDGKVLAYSETIKGEHRLYLLDLETKKKFGLELLGNNKAIAHNSSFFWANNRRFVYSAMGTYTAIDRDGRNARSGIQGGRLLHLFRDEKDGMMLMTGFDIVTGEGMGGVIQRFRPNRPFVQRVNSQGVQGMAVGLHDTFVDKVAGIREVDNPGSVIDWVVDAAGEVRAAKEIKGTRYHVLYRENDKAGWGSLPGLGWQDPESYPLGFSVDGHTLYVGRVSPAGTWAVYPYDLGRQALGEPIIAHAKYDIVHPASGGYRNGIGQQGLIYSPKEKRLLGVRYATEFPGMLWLDEGMAQVQAALDQALPRKINTITSLSDDLQRMVVLSWTAQDPGTYYLFDRSTQQLDKLMASMPWIDPEAMGSVRPVRYKARDGVTINGYLTLPPGREPANLPMVVLVDSIQNRSYWGFNPEAQFWATRGYAVLEVNFRGLPGYGDAFAHAADGKAGTVEPADIADGVRWAIAKKFADPARVAIIGTWTYGAYFALQSLVTEPDLYRCGVENAGYTDWLKILDRSKLAPDFYELMIERFGDPAQPDAAARISSVAPINHIGKIKAPLLVTFDRDDFRDDWYNNQSRDFVKAMKDAGKQVELIDSYDEPYGFQTVAKYYNDRLAFVQRYMPAD